MPTIQSRCEASGYNKAQEAMMRAWQARFGNLQVIDATRAMRDLRAFYDPHHLSAEGAYPFSLALGDVLRKSLGTPAAPRWITLATFTSRPLPDHVEDLHETVAALEALQSAR